MDLQKYTSEHVKIDITNAAEWLKASGVNSDLLVNFAPPFEWGGFYFRKDSWIDSIPKSTGYYRVHLDVHDVGDSEQGRKNLGFDDDEVRWVQMVHFYDMEHELDTGKRIGMAKEGIRQDGTLSSYVFFGRQLSAGALPDGDVVKEILYSLSLPVKFATSLFHCRNVEMVDKPTSRQYRRLMERKGEAVDKYKVLVIEPFKKQVRKQAHASGENEIERALHICRGHFATYTEDAPLFGKYTGTFWRPMHVRGNPDAGKVVKDYKVVTDDD